MECDCVRSVVIKYLSTEGYRLRMKPSECTRKDLHLI